MKYSYLNEISRYFKPVDYIGELTPEEKEERDLQKYYADNMDRLRKIAEEFDVNKDSVNFTFYKTLYQTGEKTTCKIDNLGLDSPTDNPGFGFLLETIIRHMLDYIGEMLSDETNAVQGYAGISAEIEHYTDDGSSPEILTVVYIPDVRKYKPIFYPEYSGDKPWYELNPYVYTEPNHDDTVFIRFVFNRVYILTKNTANNITEAVRKLGKIQQGIEDPLQYMDTKYKWEFPYKPASPEEILNALSDIDIDIPTINIYKLYTLCTRDNIKDERIFNTLNFYFENYYNDRPDFLVIFDGFVYCMRIKYFYGTDISKLLESPVKDSSDLLTRIMEDAVTPTVNYLKDKETEIKSLITDFSNCFINSLHIDPGTLHIKFALIVENITRLAGQSMEPTFKLECSN